VHLRASARRSVLRHAAAARGWQRIDRDQILRKLVEIHTNATTRISAAALPRSAAISSRWCPRIEEHSARDRLFGDDVDELAWFDPLTGQGRQAARQDRRLPEVAFVTSRPHEKAVIDQAGSGVVSAACSRSEGKLLEAQRLHQRTMFDLEMIREIGYCHGIENYSPHLTGRRRTSRRRRCSTICRTMRSSIVDESHQTVPQVAGCSRGPLAQGSARRLRLPAAIGPRQPAAEFRRNGSSGCRQVVFVSATPGPYEL
jgi:excinuclease ABC subunit B